MGGFQRSGKLGFAVFLLSGGICCGIGLFIYLVVNYIEDAHRHGVQVRNGSQGGRWSMRRRLKAAGGGSGGIDESVPNGLGRAAGIIVLFYIQSVGREPERYSWFGG